VGVVKTRKVMFEVAEDLLPAAITDHQVRAAVLSAIENLALRHRRAEIIRSMVINPAD
jgi:hypothetical protein